MTAPALTYIPNILEEHLEELAFLWGQRRTALRSPRYTFRAFAHLEERVTAHLQGVLAVGDEALPLLEDTLREGDSSAAFAAAYALLHHRDGSATARVLDAFAHADGARLGGLRDALCQGPTGPVLPQIQALAHSPQAPLAVAAAEALAFHTDVGLTDRLVRQFLTDEDVAVRAGGWRLIGYLGMRLDPKTYAAALRDDPVVKRAALHAGAWCGEPGVVAVGRQLAERPAPEHADALELLAILGGPEDLARFAAIGQRSALGPGRFHLLGCFGHPGLVELLLAGMRDPDAATAVAAGAAFTKMTGAEIESANVARLSNDGSAPADEFAMEFLDEVKLPDPILAQRHWDKVGPQVSQASRMCRGVDVGGALAPERFALLDMESRWEACLRARFHGVWSGSPLRLERFPHGRS
jgi:uncharacterized protein (TIGR02270 family)